MKQSQNTRVVSGGRRGGSGSHSGEWRGSGVLPGAREKASVVACTWAAPGQRENTGTVAKQKHTDRPTDRPTTITLRCVCAREG